MLASAMVTGRSQEDCHRNVEEIIPSTATNDEIQKLQVVGTNVFASERTAALKLLKDVKVDNNAAGIRLLWHKCLEEHNSTLDSEEANRYNGEAYRSPSNHSRSPVNSQYSHS